MINIYGRLGLGDKAMECLHLILKHCTVNNLFTYHNASRKMVVTLQLMWCNHKPYHIDCNCGIVSGLIELLLFSAPREVRLLPVPPGTSVLGV